MPKKAKRAIAFPIENWQQGDREKQLRLVVNDASVFKMVEVRSPVAGFLVTDCNNPMSE